MKLIGYVTKGKPGEPANHSHKRKKMFFCHSNPKIVMIISSLEYCIVGLIRVPLS